MYYSKTLFAQKSYSFAPFIAPLDFDVDNEEFNIYELFLSEASGGKRAIFSVGQASTTTVFTAVSGRSFKIGQEVDGVMTYTTIASGTYTWTVGSTKRHVIVLQSASSITFIIPISAIWVYIGMDVAQIYSITNNTTLKYIHRDISNQNLTLSWLSAFSGCSNLTGIWHVPPGFTVVPSTCFRGCANLTGWSGEDIISSVQNAAFQNCSKFNGKLPNFLTSIGGGSFESCPLSGASNLLTLTSAVANSMVKAFYRSYFLSGSVKVPEGVTSIGQCFWECYNLTYVILPSTITAYSSTFYGCNKIERIDIYKTTPPSTENPSFHSTIKNTCVVHVPAGCIPAYRANTYWNEMVNIIDDL